MEDSWLDHVLGLVPNVLKVSYVYQCTIFSYYLIIVMIIYFCQDGYEICIENLSDEMKEDYLLSVKKAIGRNIKRVSLNNWEVKLFLTLILFLLVDFVLKDPREKDDDKKEEVLEHRLE